MKIVVVGSLNAEMIFSTPVLPLAGQSVPGTSFTMTSGGRGANQAIAAVRAGAEVHFAGRTGTDFFGDFMVKQLVEQGIDAAHLIRDPGYASGVSSVMVDDKGETMTVLSSGANDNLTPADLRDMRFVLTSAEVLLLQLEIPVDTVRFAASLARSSGVKVILNPSPALPVSDEVLRSVSVLTPDAVQAEQLTGVRITDERTAELAGRILLERGLDRVIITLGTTGAMVIDNGGAEHVPGYPAPSGNHSIMNDAFNGALAVALGEGNNFYQAVQFANAAAALTAAGPERRPVFPLRSEILSFMKTAKRSL
jgi:ribokinase